MPRATRGSVKGNFKQGFRWNDLDGEHYLILTETGPFGSRQPSLDFDTPQTAELYAYCFTVTNGRFSQAWRITDFVRDCPLDTTAEFIPAATEITDLDNDGSAEVWVMYKTACRSDVSPATLKIIMYEGNQKYALRGRTRIALPDFSDGGEQSPDARLRTNRRFLQHAKRKWRQFYVESSQ
ncbi:MAG: M949_RS01915 family surface polysaccharide biosynthesis protein [Acidobacteriota bacterium]